jgi:hypothetical protein
MSEQQPLLNTHPQLKDFVSFLNYLNEESDRGKVLIAAAMLDDLLLKSLQAFLIDGKSASKLINGFNAPLGTFSARIEAAFAMGLLNEIEYRELNLIRKIRNEFAHTIEITFENPVLKQYCQSLNYSAKSYGDVIVSASGQFTTSATSLILNLTNRPHYVSLKRLSVETWPY